MPAALALLGLHAALYAAIVVLEIGGVDDGLHQQALGVDEDVTLLAFDLLAGIAAGRIDREPP